MANKAENKEIAPVYSREELLANAEAIFNCKPEVVEGALHGDPRAEFTVEEVKKAVNGFLKRRVN